ncbi:prephenate dehydrogenase [Candidatus Spongiihabitans sp.]|uniref:prephenate dehydrogenase n=1 Tax=Candidatus Spongiihabitans sp. TaxID=3101308 RepID=UPI003C7AC580
MNATSSHPIRTLAIVGVGLIGGSLGLALKRAGAVGRVIGVGRSPANLDTARSRGAIDEIQPDLRRAVSDADVIVLATPVNTIAALFGALAPALTDDKIITDVGSVKAGVCAAASAALGARISRFVPGHPIAGKEKSGIAAAAADLFENHKVILTPSDATDPQSCLTIKKMWQTIGAEVKSMTVSEHDRVLSITSHLPHVLSYVMMDFLATSPEREHCYQMAAGGFYDFTRTASSDPEMWRDISIMNKRHLLEHIAKFKRQLNNVAAMIDADDETAIEDLYASARRARALVTEKRKLES